VDTTAADDALHFNPAACDHRRDNQTVPAQLPDEGQRANEVMSQLDLNTADAASLSAIPRLGEVKAKAIVAYREQFIAAHPGQRAFEHMESLYRIKGIGPSTMELLRQYTYISVRATTKPISRGDVP
jgi:competence protein ComEA